MAALPERVAQAADQALRRVLDPELGTSVVELGLVREVSNQNGRLRVRLETTSAACPMAPVIADAARSELADALPDWPLDLSVTPPGGDPAARPWTPPVPPVMLLAGVGLLAGLATGLARLGLDPGVGTRAGLHGPLMVVAFLGTLISLERAVAVGRAWAWAAPALFGASGVALLVGAPGLSAAAAAGGALGLTLVSLQLVAQDSGPAMGTMAAGALALLAAQVLVLTGSTVASVVPLWVAFLLGTVLGERIELAQREPSSLLERLRRRPGLPRYNALCLLGGYGWLAVAALCLPGGIPAGGPEYDLAVHAVFVGFGFSMIFGHAPIVLPAVLGRPLPFHPVLYLPLALLHGSLALRAAGDLLPALELRQLGGSGNVAAIALFALCAITLSLRAHLAREP